jgi:hypothetical protein
MSQGGSSVGQVALHSANPVVRPRLRAGTDRPSVGLSLSAPDGPPLLSVPYPGIERQARPDGGGTSRSPRAVGTEQRVFSMNPADRHPEILDRLSAGIAELTNSDRWRRHLGFQSRSRQYSFGNVILIVSQCPEATNVAGFRTWTRLGRHVQKGQRAIWILAPMITLKGSVGPSDDDREICGFKYVPVFDISQTDGEDVPEVCSRLAGDDPGACFSRLVGAAQALDYTVEDAELAPGTNGLCSFHARRIEVEVRNSPAQRVKTLAHEIAHAVMHEGHQDRSLAELEAESTAYVVCQQFGLDSGAYSFGYVATWAGGGEQAVSRIRASCANIQRAATLIIDLLTTPGLDAAAPAAAADLPNSADELPGTIR